MTTTVITVKSTINAPVEKVWDFWTGIPHIVKWNSPSPEWHTPRGEHDLKAGGRFNLRMEARDGSMGFDFSGRYDVVNPNKRLEYTLDDGRKVNIAFEGNGQETRIVQEFEAETENSIEMQQSGWQAILDNFKGYAEANGGTSKK